MKHIYEKIEKLYESTPRYCRVYKTDQGNWYLELAPHEHGERDDAYTYGPFRNEDDAFDYTNHFSNPGGGMVDRDGKEPEPKISPNGEPVKGV